MPLFAQNVRKRVRAIPHSTNRAIADLIASRGGTLCHPIMPVANRLGSGFVRIDGGQLGKRDGHLTPLPMDQHEHVGGAAVFRRHTSYFDSVSFAERRDDFGSDALGLKGESDFVIEIVIPAQRLLFRLVGVRWLGCGCGLPGSSLSSVFSRLCCQDSAHRGAPDLQPAGDLGFANTGTV